MITVQDLFIYPIKSLGGIKHTRLRALQKGFEFDRRWMLVDESGKFITQRIDHKLALLKTEIVDNTIVIRHRKNSSLKLSIPLKGHFASKMDVTIWNDKVDGFLLNTDADLWFSNYLQKPCRLVFMKEEGQRSVDPRYAKNDEQVSFADSFPYMLIGKASLDDLNSRLDAIVPMDRFRPSIVVSGSTPFEEDTWAEIKIGEVIFKVSKPCARCVATTIDQQTSEKSSEPLYTLSQYRSLNNKVLFGQNLLALNEGTITEGSEVKVLRYK